MSLSKGYTIVEMMITVGIFAIVATMAYPQYQDLVNRNTVDKLRDDLYVDLVLARSEALSRNRSITVCSSDNPMAFNPVCTNGANDWNTGWLIFTDTDGDQAMDAAQDVNGDGNMDTPADELIRVYANEASDVTTLRYASFGSAYLTFDRLGRLAEESNGSYWACSRLTDFSVRIIVNKTGRGYYSAGDVDEC